MEAYVDDLVQGEIPRMDLDDLYSAKAELADFISKGIAGQLSKFCILVRHCFLTDIAPDK